MFRKRVKKEYPAGTFIPTPARLCAIIQLSLAFMIILWNISQPFMGELFTYKSQMLIYQDVMGISKWASSNDAVERQDRNRQRFERLPISENKQLTQQFMELQQLTQRTFSDKFGRSLHIIIYEIPLYEQLWLILSLILPILLLKRVDGAVQAIWLLPLLAAVYSLDNHWYGRPTSLSNEAKLFPTEQVLINDYLKQPLSEVLLKQKDQLAYAWKLYLIQNWSSNKNMNFNQLAEEGEFAFNVARIKSLPLPKEILTVKKQAHREPLFLLALYLFWNFFFAIKAYQYGTLKPLQRTDALKFVT